MMTTIFTGVMALTTLVTAIAAWFKYRKDSRLAHRMRRQEIYQRLESATASLFKFEVEHIDAAIHRADDNFDFSTAPEKMKFEMANHTFQLTSLFEMSIKLHREDSLDDEVFTTFYLRWLFNVAQRANFWRTWDERDFEMHHTDTLTTLLRKAKACGNFTAFTQSICDDKVLCQDKRCKKNCHFKKCLREARLRSERVQPTPAQSTIHPPSKQETPRQSL